MGPDAGNFFNDKVVIENHAVNGRSTKSYLDEGLWAVVENILQPGDYVFIQFGHNDQKDYDPARYTNPVTSYRANLELFVREARQKGAIPILATSVVRRNFNEHGVLVDTHGLYPLIMRQVASELSVPLVDLQLETEKLVLQLGEEESKRLYMWVAAGEYDMYPDGKEDNTHLSAKGAKEFARLVAKQLPAMDTGLEQWIDQQALQND